MTLAIKSNHKPRWTEFVNNWPLLATLFIAGFLAFGSGVYAFTLFLPPIEQEFGWGRALTGGSVSVFWLCAPVLPLIGWLADRYGPRLLVAGGLLLEGSLFLFIYFVSAAWQLYLIRFVMGIGKLLVFVPTPTAVAKSFNLCQGLATGVVLAGTHVGGVVMSSIAQQTIDGFGWRTSAVIIGLIIIVVGVPVALLYLEPGPVEERHSNIGKDNKNPIVIEGWSVKKTLRHSTFWLIGFATLIYFYGFSAVLFHLPSYLTDMNMSSQTVATSIGAIATFAAISCLLVGLLIDKFGTLRTLIGCFLLQGSAVTCLIFFKGESDLPFLIYFVVAYGIALGATDVAWCVLIKEQFGVKNYGAIFGFWYLFVVTMFVSGAVISGSIYDQLGSYLFGFIPVPVGGVVAIILLLIISRRSKATLGIDNLNPGN